MNRPNEPILPDPLAYFLTWPAYGTWLPGDERGWNKRGQGRRNGDDATRIAAAARMNDRPICLSNAQRQLVELTISNHCEIRGWRLFAVNCRSNHVHVVVCSAEHPDEVAKQLKAWCSRRLKKQAQLTLNVASQLRTKWWAERCSKRYLNDGVALDLAIQYVRECQDEKGAS